MSVPPRVGPDTRPSRIAFAEPAPGASPSGSACHRHSSRPPRFNPMTGERRGRSPALACRRRAAKIPEGCRCNGWAGRQVAALARCAAAEQARTLRAQKYKSGFCEVLANIAHLHFRVWRGRPVSGRSVRRDHHPHAAEAGAIDLDVLRQRGSDRRRRTGDAKGGTAHGLFVGVEGSVANGNVRDNDRQVRLTFIAVKCIRVSSREDR